MLCFVFFFFNDTATTEIYTLSLHDALPIYYPGTGYDCQFWMERNVNNTGWYDESGVKIITPGTVNWASPDYWDGQDRKSTRLNSSHSQISYAVFCLKKKKHKIVNTTSTNSN